jgi:hypothetical protein
MKNSVLSSCAVAVLGLLGGCTFLPAPPPETVLEGTWTVTPAVAGDFEGFTYEARFDSSGSLVEITGARPDGATASLEVDDATTTLDGNSVTISIPRLTWTTVFNGTLSDDQNTIAGNYIGTNAAGTVDSSQSGGYRIPLAPLVRVSAQSPYRVVA